MRKLAGILLGLVLLAAVGSMFYAQWLNGVMRKAGPHTQAVELIVKPGATVKAVLADLERQGALSDRRAVELELRLKGWPKIKSGRYEIVARASPGEIIRQLADGRVVLEQVTIVEGWTFAQMRRALERHPQIRATLKGQDDAAVMRALGHPGQHPEGLFFPDTYRFAAGIADRELLEVAYGRMQQILDVAWQGRAADLPIKSAYEALVLASIVEKETGLASERAQIAGVFTTRMRKGMRLQTDPTVIYGLGAGYDGNLRERDLRADTPYNTYTRKGLPPTPIALPSQQAIAAAVRPRETGDIFFVATGNGDGSHFFSADLEAHNAAVARYLQRLRNAPATSRP
jgi:UPF0755 protein